MRIPSLLITALLVCPAVVPLAAHIHPFAVQTTGQPVVLQVLPEDARNNPYRNLFVVPLNQQKGDESRKGQDERQKAEEQLRAVIQARRGAAPGPKIICGMKVFAGDPSIDAGIRIQPPDKNVNHTIRAITPPICVSDEARDR